MSGHCGYSSEASTAYSSECTAFSSGSSSFSVETTTVDVHETQELPLAAEQEQPEAHRGLSYLQEAHRGISYLEEEQPCLYRVNSSLEVDCLSVCHSMTSDAFFADPSQTLIFLDWDDTLFPTTEIYDRWKVSHAKGTVESPILSSQQEKLLEHWREALLGYLNTARGMSDRVVIVTNSQRPWVEHCVDRFAPNVKHLFARPDGPRVVYAREAFAKDEKQYRRKLGTGVPARFSSPAFATPEEQSDMSYSWKVAAMRQEAEAFYSQHKEQTWKNILSMGDMHYEFYAAQEVCFRRIGPARENLRTKTIRTPAEPSITSMTLGLTYGAHTLQLMVHYNGDIELDLNESRDRMKDISKALDLPELLEQASPEMRLLSQQSPQSVFPLLSESDTLRNHLDVLVEVAHARVND